MFDLQTYLRERKAIVDGELDARLPPVKERPTTLHEAMRYSVLGGGKRFRPILCMAATEAVGEDHRKALLPALAIEILHTYTLIHDDLPAMDNDELRRGQPTCHVKFGEANAILAGDALLTLAFQWIAESSPAKPFSVARLVVELADASGSRGIIGGQVEDIAAEGKEPDPETVEYIHLHKTAELIRSALRIGAMVGGAETKELDALTMYGCNLGLAFQITDDILNATSTSETLGKTVGSDYVREKMTYLSLYGVEGARKRAEELIDQAVSELDKLNGSTEPLKAIAEFVLAREK